METGPPQPRSPGCRSTDTTVASSQAVTMSIPWTQLPPVGRDGRMAGSFNADYPFGFWFADATLANT